MIKKLKINEITAQYIRECIDYTPDTGVVVWKIRPRHHFHNDASHKITNSKFAGKEIKTVNSMGYLQIKIAYRAFLLHRIIWLWVTGEWPEGEIDHINGTISNNEWKNLRDVEAKINQRNRKFNSNNTSGYKGVIWDKWSEKWKAQIYLCGKAVHIGNFDTPEEASEAYIAKATENNFTDRHMEKAPD